MFKIRTEPVEFKRLLKKEDNDVKVLLIKIKGSLERRGGARRQKKNAISALKKAKNRIFDFCLLGINPSKWWNCFTIFTPKTVKSKHSISKNVVIILIILFIDARFG